jgi:hypothetical protein
MDQTLEIAKPIIAFVVSLLAIGGLLAASLSLVLKVSNVQAAGAAVGFLAWLWAAAQSAASSFRVTQSLAPSYLSNYFKALTSLQFVGISLPPECIEGSSPFAVAWAGIFGTSALILAIGLGVVIVALCKRYGRASAETTEKKSMAEFAVRSLALALTMTQAAIIGSFTTIAVCTAPQEMTTRSYLSLRNDGSLLRSHVNVTKALVTTNYTMEDVKLAFVNASFARVNTKINNALDAVMQVRLVAYDMGSVCNEGTDGEHGRIWGPAVALLVVVIVGLPLLIIWAMGFRVCKSKTAKEARGEDDNDQQPIARPDSVKSIIAGAFYLQGARDDAQWYQAMQLGVSGILSVTSSIGTLETDGPSFYSLLTVSAVVALAGAYATARFAPYTGELAWQNLATTALLILPAVASVSSLILFATNERAPPDVAQAFGIIPLVTALLLPVPILLAWWRSMRFYFKDVTAASSSGQATKPVADASSLSSDGPTTASENDALAIRTPQLTTAPEPPVVSPPFVPATPAVAVTIAPTSDLLSEPPASPVSAPAASSPPSKVDNKSPSFFSRLGLNAAKPLESTSPLRTESSKLALPALRTTSPASTTASSAVVESPKTPASGRKSASPRSPVRTERVVDSPGYSEATTTSEAFSIARERDARSLRVSLAKNPEFAMKPNASGVTPIMYACRHGLSPGVVRELIAAGASLSEVDAAGRTPLQLAARSGSADIISILLEAGAEANARDMAGQTALHQAANSGVLQAVRALVAAGASLEARDLSNSRPFDLLQDSADSALKDVLRT